MIVKDDMRDRPPPCWPDGKAPDGNAQEVLAIDQWLRRGFADRFGAALEPAPDDLVRLVSTLFP